LSENERQELEALGNVIEPQRWFSDTISGKVPANERPQFSRIVERMESGYMLLVSKLDRLGRDMIDVVQTICTLTNQGVKVKVLALGDVDLTSTAGKAVLGILVTVAEMARDLLVERTQAGLARAKAEGRKLGCPSRTSENDKERIRAQIQKGVTVSQIARDFDISRASVMALRDAV